jgi:hypothetical protein
LPDRIRPIQRKIDQTESAIIHIPDRPSIVVLHSTDICANDVAITFQPLQIISPKAKESHSQSRVTIRIIHSYISVA